MANVKNLKNIKLSHEEAVKNGKKGGIASALAKRKKKTFQSALKSVLVYDGYTNKRHEGVVLNGYEVMAFSLFDIAQNPENRQCISAIRLILELTGEDLSGERLKHEKLKSNLTEADIKLKDARTKVLESELWDNDPEDGEPSDTPSPVLESDAVPED